MSAKRKFKVGDLAILKSNLDKNYQKGDIVTITRPNYGGSYTIQPFEDTINIPNLWVSVRYLDTIDVNSDNPNINNVKQILMEKLIKDFTSRKEKLQQELQNIEDKLRYIEESGCTTFNENEFKVYKTLQLLEEKQDLSRMEKAQAIAKLISNK